MKKEYLIWISAAGAALAGSGIAVTGLLAALPKSVPLAGAAIALCSVGVLCFLIWQFMGKVRTMSHFLQNGDTLSPRMMRGTILEEAAGLLQNQQLQIREALEKARQDNQDLGLQVQLLNRRKSGIEEILNSIRDAVIVTDDKDRLLTANRSAQVLFGFEFHKDTPKTAEEAIDRNELVWLIRKCRESKTPHVRHEVTFEKNERPVTYDAVLSCVEDDAGNAVQVVTVLHDITREKEISQMKNDFVSHVSHELKTPLASINAYAEMLVDGEAEDTETIQQFCSVIQGQAQRLSRLIEDILNISRIESGLIKVNRQTHSLALIIRDACEMITSYAQEKNIAVHSPAAILYDQVFIDKDMISQVVINLLSNAVKYTPANGEITVCSELNEAEGQITVTVTDTGVGIPPEDVDHVFDKFYRVEANNKYAKGTGLGLNLVKQIVETVHGGSVFVQSTPGAGSTFGFVLPLSRETAAQPA